MPQWALPALPTPETLLPPRKALTAPSPPKNNCLLARAWALPTNPNEFEPLPSGRCSGYAYLTAGGVNWVVIGYPSEPTTISTQAVNLWELVSLYCNYSNYNENSIWNFVSTGAETPAGSSIWNEYDVGKDMIYNTLPVTISQKLLFPNAKPSDELEAYEVLCFAQDLMPQRSGFRTDGSNKYAGSTLQSNLNTFYDNNLQSLPISPKPLSTTYSSGVDDSITDAKIFPLSGVSSDSFYVLDFFTSSSSQLQSSSWAWWLRSGVSGNAGYSHWMAGSGVIRGQHSQFGGMGFQYGVRAAFVLKI